MDKLNNETNNEVNNNANVEAENIEIIKQEEVETDCKQENEEIKDSSITEKEIEKLEDIHVEDNGIEESNIVEKEIQEQDSSVEKEKMESDEIKDNGIAEKSEDVTVTEKEIDVDDSTIIEKEIETEDNSIVEKEIETQGSSIIEKDIQVKKDNINKTKTNKISNRKAIRKVREFKPSNIYMRAMSFIVMSIFLFGAAIGKAGAISFNDNKITFNSIYSHENTDNENNNKKNSKKKDNKADTKYKNTSDEGQKFIYDAVEVSKKLKKCDYQNGGKKIVFLTFDDGASNTVTPKILKILDDYNVKATFFIMGSVLEDGGENAKKLVKEEYDKGHAIGNHSYCHDYSVLYPGRHLDLDAFKNDYSKNENELKKILGDDFSTRVIRCPGGYMSWKDMDKLDEYLDENNMASIDWSALSGDAEGEKKDASQLLKYAVESSMNQEMVVLLMHDTYGKEETAKSLPKIIEYFKGHGYEFRTLG